MLEIHEKAKQDYLKGLKYKEIAEKYKVSLNTVKSWKTRYRWNRKSAHTTEEVRVRKRGAPKGNRNAVGNHSSLPGNKKAEKHGFFSKIFPEEVMGIVENIQLKSPLDMLWESIVIQYAAIARAQTLMFVKNQDDITKLLKRQKESKGLQSDSWEKEYEIQFAWDKHANFLQAQSRAMNTLQGMIAKYEELLLKSLATEEQKLRIEKLKAEVNKLKGIDNETENTDDGFREALQGKVEGVWSDEKD